jgi:hypothetical protein
MMEAERLNWLRNNQSKLRVGKYHKLNENVGDPQQKKAKELFFPLLLLEVEDIWISYTLMAWLYQVILDFLIFLLLSLAIQTGQKFKENF